MPRKKDKKQLYSIFDSVSGDLIAARTQFRDNYVQGIEQETPKVQALSATNKFTSSPKANIVGVGIGEKVSAGKYTGELCIKVLVAKKFPKSQVSRGNSIAPSIDGVSTDIEGVGYIGRLAVRHRTRIRPAQPGISISPVKAATHSSMAGTLGIVSHERGKPENRYIISNNHVLANENLVDKGEAIIQPGTLDGGKNGDRVARLTHVVPLRFQNRRNWMDAAAAKFDASLGVDKTILGIGEPRSGGRARLNSLVRKSGRTTGVTEGIVRILKLDLFNVGYSHGMARIDQIFAVEGVSGAFSNAGDSGSGVMDERGRVVGLLFAGGGSYSYIIPIGRILRRFKMRI